MYHQHEIVRIHSSSKTQNDNMEHATVPCLWRGTDMAASCEQFARPYYTAKPPKPPYIMFQVD